MKVGDEFPRRLARFSKGLARCTGEASSYAKCVITQPNLKQHDCLKEFNVLHQCIQKHILNRQKMKVDQEFCQNEPEKYKLCLPHLCVHKDDPCHSPAYTAASVSPHDVQPIALIVGLTIGSLFLCILIVALVVFKCRRRKSQGDYHKTDFQLFSSAIALNDCDADPESPHHKTKSKSKQLLPHLPKHGYKLIPMLSSFPKVHKAFMSPAKKGDSRRNSSSSLTSNPNSGGRRSSDLGRGSSGGSPIVMSPAAAAARHQYRLVPDADMPSRIYKNPGMMNNSPKATNSKSKKLAANNKNIQMSMLARIT